MFRLNIGKTLPSFCISIPFLILYEYCYGMISLSCNEEHVSVNTVNYTLLPILWNSSELYWLITCSFVLRVFFLCVNLELLKILTDSRFSFNHCTYWIFQMFEYIYFARAYNKYEHFICFNSSVDHIFFCSERLKLCYNDVSWYVSLMNDRLIDWLMFAYGQIIY